MRAAKVVGVIFLLMGLLFAIIGAIKYIISFTEADERIYATAYIVRIDERQTGDPEFPVKHTTYVELDVNGEKIIAKLNTYKSSFKIGQQIDIYYFENDIHMAYQNGSEHWLLLFPLVGMIAATLGAVLTFRNTRC